MAIRKVGDCRLLGPLGKGGMALVYRGVHETLQREVAIKELTADAAKDAEKMSRFKREAMALAAFHHQHIVTLYDLIEKNDGWYMVMELVDGPTLGELIKEAPLPPQVVMVVALQLAQALEHAHFQKVVHRDLKPGNVMLSKTGETKLMDFGIVQNEELDRLTKAGLAVGTPAYMSPEQVMGDEGLDARSDVYSLGLVAYRMLTGRLPFEGNVMQLMQGHLNGTVTPLRTHVLSLSEAIETVVMKCLARQPDARFQSMKELRRELFTLGGRAPVAFSAEEAKPAVKVAAHAVIEVPKPAQSPTASIPPPAAAAAAAPAQAPSATAKLPAKEDTRVFQTMREEQAERVQAIAVASRMKDIITKRLQADTLKLPALPEVAVKCLELAHDPESSFGDVARLIERDPFIASRVVRLSNSPVYGGLARISSVDGAVSRIGMKTLTTVLQELAAEQVFASKDATIRNAFRGIWEHCLGVATLARDLCQHVSGIDPNAAYLAGLFHDIGKPVVAALLLEVERGTSQKSAAAFLSGGVWRRVVEECHREVGAIIAYRWYLPQEVAQAIAQLDTYDLKRGRSTANVVRLSNGLCQREGLDVKAADIETVTRVILQGRQVLRVSEEQVETSVKGLAHRVQSLTQEKTEPEGGSTRVFERSVG